MRLIRRKHSTAIGVLAAAALALTACSGTTPGAPDDSGEIGDHTLVFAYITAESFPYHAGAQKFKEVLEKATEA